MQVPIGSLLVAPQRRRIAKLGLEAGFVTTQNEWPAQIFDFADELAGGLRSGSEGWQCEARVARNQRVPIVPRRLSNR